MAVRAHSKGPPAQMWGRLREGLPEWQFHHLPLKGEQQVIEWRTKERARWKEQMGHHILMGLKVQVECKLRGQWGLWKFPRDVTR